MQHAVRAHFLRVMEIESDKILPESHVEGTPLPPYEPIRFVWDKTPKQSVHNGRMKARFIADIKERRRLYRYVPDKEFGKKTLDSAFDQAFATLRQKYKAQKDANIALATKRKESEKNRRARRLSRKKTVCDIPCLFVSTDSNIGLQKLSNRSDTRNRIEAFEHITFDGALQMECMSSEESSSENEGGSSQPSTLYRIRGLPWRSVRLCNFYATLDEGDQVDKNFRPKRGIGRRERCLGPLKDGFFMPPKGVASWMVSRRWVSSLQMTNPELVTLLKDIVVDPPGFDWGQFTGLGSAESDEEGMRGNIGSEGVGGYDDIHFGHELEFEHHQYVPHSDNVGTSSLHNALAPV